MLILGVCCFVNSIQIKACNVENYVLGVRLGTSLRTVLNRHVIDGALAAGESWRPLAYGHRIIPLFDDSTTTTTTVSQLSEQSHPGGSDSPVHSVRQNGHYPGSYVSFPPTCASAVRCAASQNIVLTGYSSKRRKFVAGTIHLSRIPTKNIEEERKLCETVAYLLGAKLAPMLKCRPHKATGILRTQNNC